MKKIRYVLFLLFVIFISINYIKANSLYNIDMNVVLDENGNARVSEIWDVYTNKDTELYKCMYNLGNSKVGNFSVSLNDKLFTYEEYWDIDASFDMKKYKNGFNYTSEGVELCFGISEYGNKLYEMKYDLSNMVFNTEDAQVLYFKFISGMSMMDDARYNISISGPNKFEDTLDVWGFGVKGYTYVKDGKIYSSPSEEVYLNSESDYAVLLVKFPLGTFNTNNKYSQYNTFDDVYTIATENTYEYDYDYEEDDNFDSIDFTSLLIFGLMIWGIVHAVKNSGKYRFGEAGKKINMKEINMFRDIPCKKDIFRAYFVADVYGLNKDNTDFIGSLFLKWISEDKITIKKEIKKKLFKDKEVTSLIFKDNIEFNNSAEKEMYDMMISASNDGILEDNEFTKYAKKHYKKVLDWFEDALECGRDSYMVDGLVTKVKRKYFIDDKLKGDTIELAGLKKYLIEFSNMKEKEAIEVKLWREYLMYAQIFGIADKVAKQFEKLYPEVIAEMNECHFDVMDIIILNNMSRDFVHAASDARSAAQSYSSGGGGFNIGGGGGGSFGGGGGGSR